MKTKHWKLLALFWLGFSLGNLDIYATTWKFWLIVLPISLFIVIEESYEERRND